MEQDLEHKVGRSGGKKVQLVSWLADSSVVNLVGARVLMMVAMMDGSLG